jgi:hypothetical protein
MEYVELLSIIQYLKFPVATAPNLEAQMMCAMQTMFFTSEETVSPSPWYGRYIFVLSAIKGTVQRKLRGVQNGINQKVLL